MHENGSNNMTYKKFKDFKESLLNFFDEIMANILELMTIFRIFPENDRKEVYINKN